MFDEVLAFWFSELQPAQWWRADGQLDELIRLRFGSVHRAASTGECHAWRVSARGRLAEIIVLDQFSRNIFRSSPQAFASDVQALVLAQEAVRVGCDMELPLVQRHFLYMPYMHSESLLIHDLAAPLFKERCEPGVLDEALRHRSLIERFGRYPARNVALGRASTRDEIAYLQKQNG